MFAHVHTEERQSRPHVRVRRCANSSQFILWKSFHGQLLAYPGVSLFPAGGDSALMEIHGEGDWPFS